MSNIRDVGKIIITLVGLAIGALGIRWVGLHLGGSVKWIVSLILYMILLSIVGAVLITLAKEKGIEPNPPPLPRAPRTGHSEGEG